MRAWNESALRALQNQNSQWHPWQKEQLKTFLLHGFPHRKVENWKYTNVTPIAEQAFSFGENTDADIADFILPDAYRLVFINGHFAPRLSDLSGLPSAVQMTSLKNIQRDIQNELAIKKDYQTAFSLMNDALFQDGLFLQVPKDCYLEKPIHLIHLSKPTASLTMSQIRHVILLEENAKAVIFEEYQGTNGVAYFNNVVTQIKVNSAAHLELYKLQQEGDRAFHIANTSIHQNRHSQVTSGHIAMGSELSRDDLNYSLDEAGASCQLLGFYYLNDGCHVDNHTRIDHRVSHCTSQQNYKGILADKSRAVFNGKIIVQPNAKQTSAHQTNKNLILSSDAEVDTKPELEIYNDDVKCTHGATVGQLNEEAIFYLQSRGINRGAAEHLLTCAFANEVVEMLPNKVIADRIQQLVTDRLATPYCQGACCHA
ncbi:Fe-S cluster assembly protein SufD [Coxiella burnetii]|uniref:SufD n=1 Tax=Coxiella burnetii (strain Dugway 5J108-111) TaxID=434922 RepID=A9KGF1_COXBN|nr:Fe-S cluster assembly protein SufD [Coxiella burnetii]ABS76820.1 SufD [Coxiella burnetii Dugway 5J108-111]ACJ20406.1 SufD [Coxiella burnetii CbuK_Q154]ATN86047.1 Fe-S cluster assembly protein SufD [Coxiella burnetii str. Schperling]EAX32026.2 Fe-S cluster assembly protein SufD [Coxiella burnetii 'MSU Goat Q177']EDR35106.1 FeS assembly protein SufD [Coxiella burnetii Q321]